MSGASDARPTEGPAVLPQVGRIGVFGGTFDPIHSGHVAVAATALDSLQLVRVDLVPSFSPPHRAGHTPQPGWHRWAMTVLACAGRPGLFANDRELRRGGVSYMIETLRSYREDEPPVVPVLLLGVDAFADLPSWRQPEELVGEFDVAVLTRPGFDPEAVFAGLPDWLRRRIGPLGRLLTPSPGDGRIGLLPVPAHPVSATMVRQARRRGECIDSLVPGAVAEYIEKYALYGG